MMAQWQFKSKIVGTLLLMGISLSIMRVVSYNQAFNFSLGRIRSYFAYCQDWDIERLPDQEMEQLHHILSQPFHYLNAGARSYVFESEDKNYVIKFFISKQPRLGIKDLFRFEKREQRWQKVKKICDAYVLAYQEMKDDTALVYLHLNHTSSLSKTVKLIDKLHRVHFVDLDHTEFVIQKKAELFLDRMKRLQKNQDVEGMNQALSQMMTLLERREKKGVADQDKGAFHNFGFIGSKVVQIGIGGLYHGQNEQATLEMRAKVDEWFDRQK
ncbi:MAG: hypothetical protein QRY72_03525 [Candidatus Rhabdochlamydia sp.]